VDSSGNVIMTGEFYGDTVDFGGGALTSVGTADIYVAKFSGTNGAHIWSKRFGSTADDVSYAVAADNSGNVVLTGFFTGSVDFGGGPLTTTRGTDADLFVAKFSSAGLHLWSKRFSGGSTECGYGVAVDGSGDVLVTGDFAGGVDFGGGQLMTAGFYDSFLAKLSGVDGRYVWARRFGGVGQEAGRGVAVDGSGNVVITGYFGSSTDFGGGTVANSSLDGFVAKYSGVDGHYLWARRLGGTGADEGRGVVVDGSGNVLVTGYFQTSADFGGGPLTSAGSSDLFVAKYAGVDGRHLWSQRWGGLSNDLGSGVATDSGGNVLVTGFFWNTVDFGNGPLTSAGLGDIPLVRRGP
jgi:hypothetical protein